MIIEAEYFLLVVLGDIGKSMPELFKGAMRKDKTTVPQERQLVQANITKRGNISRVEDFNENNPFHYINNMTTP